MINDWIGAHMSPGKEPVECISGDWPIYGIDIVSWEQSAGHTE